MSAISGFTKRSDAIAKRAQETRPQGGRSDSVGARELAMQWAEPLVAVLAQKVVEGGGPPSSLFSTPSSQDATARGLPTTETAPRPDAAAETPAVGRFESSPKFAQGAISDALHFRHSFFISWRDLES